MRSDLSPAEQLKLERSWGYYLAGEVLEDCPMMGESSRTILVNVETGDGVTPIHICKRKDCIACGKVWRHLHVNHFLRMMDGHAIYYRRVGPEENWRTLTTTLTRDGFKWQAPKDADGTRMLFSTCPDQGTNIDDGHIAILLDARTPGLGIGGRWTSCREWSFERHQVSVGDIDTLDYGTLDGLNDLPEPEADPKVVRVIRMGTMTDLLDACDEQGIEFEFDFESKRLVLTGLPAVGSTGWWRWCHQAKVNFGNHREAMRWARAA